MWFAARELLAYALHGAMTPLRFVSRRRAHAGEQPIILFIHGHGGSAGAFYFLRRALERRGYRRFSAWEYRGRGTIDGQAAALAAHAQALRGPIHIVAHSLGGLIARQWLQVHGGRARAASLVTLSTPHHGLRRLPGARLLPLVREIVRGGDLIANLARTEDVLAGLPCLAIASARDHFLGSAAKLSFATARLSLVADVGHVGVLFSREVHALVARHLETYATSFLTSR
jgi:pimeloyl-ACP methyl ester carboxylesterase